MYHRSSALLLALLATTATAFLPSVQRHPFVPTSLSSAPPSSGETGTAPITITGNNIDLTPALEAYVTEKLERTLGKLSTSRLVNEIACSVHLSVNKNPKVKDAHTAEVTTLVKGATIRVVEATPDMYSSIDFVVDRLTRKLKQYKERKLEGYHGGPHIGENLANVLNTLPDDEDSKAPPVASSDDTIFVDPYEPVVTKIKSFDLSKPISVKEAIFALDYIDHDFYVFRDEANGEVSVVYKRNAGGVGLIQPSQN